MKRLFLVVDPKGHTVRGAEGAPMYFSNKQKAKACRDSLGKDKGYTVSPGPDHKGHLPKRTRGHRRANRTHNDKRN